MMAKAATMSGSPPSATIAQTTIPVRIEQSCASHPLLRQQYKGVLPTWTGVTITARKLFGYAAMKLQDASFSQVATYEAVRRKANDLIGMYGFRLTYHPNHLAALGDSESKATLSEFVGIGLGLVAACEVFDINPNRISRYITSVSGKRMDYEVFVRGKKFLHEVRGTTCPNSVRGMIAEVGPKKIALSSGGASGLSGAVSLYSQGPDRDCITIVDPPTQDPESDDIDELPALIEYYHNVMRMTHSCETYLARLAEWIRARRSGLRLPPPLGVVDGEPFGRRVSHPVLINHPDFGGTLFDLRLTKDSVARFSSYDDASEQINEPAWFFGVDPSVETMFRRGQWSELLQYRFERPQADKPENDVLPSGVAVVPATLTSEERREAANSFRIQRESYLRSRR